MASYEGTLRCETCAYEMDVHSDGAPDVNLTIEHRTKRDHYLIVGTIEWTRAALSTQKEG